MPEKTGASVRLTNEESIPRVIGRLTLEEKAALCAGRLAFETHALPRLGIPSLTMADGHNGVNIFHLFHNWVPHALQRNGLPSRPVGPVVAALHKGGAAAIEALRNGEYADPTLSALEGDHHAVLDALSQEIQRELPEAGLPTCFPTGIVAGATWDPEMAAEYGRAVARESLAFGMDIMLGPNVNIHRDPLGGRVFESYSEDPFLTARLAVAYIQGVQGEGVSAVVKHFVANNQERDRLGGEQKISQRALREIYLPAFKAAVQEGECWMVMSAYNRVNGEACASSRRLLTDILRGEWGFQGFVVSDWSAVYDRVAALAAGNDLEMPGPADPGAVVRAVQRGELAETVLDERVSAILRVMLRLPVFRDAPRPSLDREYSLSVARRLAAEGMVLLKNERDTLPHTGGKLVVFGDNARDPVTTGLGSAWVVSPPPVSVLEGLRERFGADHVEYEGNPSSADLAVVCIGVGSGEGSDRATMALPSEDSDLVLRVAAQCRAHGTRCLVVLNACAPVEITPWLDEVDAVLHTWMAGMEIGHAVADIVSGDVCPSGKLPLTWPRSYRDAPTAPFYPGEFAETVYGEDIFVGYRYYDTAQVQPMYEFGYGLSYTRFEFGPLALSADTMDLDDDDDVLAVSLDVTNTGECRGKEVVQLYVHDVHSSVQKAVKELKGFRKVELDAGETRRVDFRLCSDDLAHFDTRRNRWCVEPGWFEVQVGASSRDIRQRARFRAVGLDPYAYSLSTPIHRILDDDKARDVLVRHLRSGALDDPALARMASCLPFAEFFRAWAEVLSGYAEGDPEQVRARIVEEWAALERD